MLHDRKLSRLLYAQLTVVTGIGFAWAATNETFVQVIIFCIYFLQLWADRQLMVKGNNIEALKVNICVKECGFACEQLWQFWFHSTTKNINYHQASFLPGTVYHIHFFRSLEWLAAVSNLIQYKTG